MNINEVKKHVYFNLAIYIGIGICFIISLIAILITPVKAQEQTTDITNSIRTNFDCPWGYNASGYCAIQTNNGGGVRSFNTRYNGVLNTISFAFPYYFNQNSNNEIIDIYSTSNDFRNNSINVSCYSYETSPSQSNTRSCSLRFISQKHIQVVYPYDSLQWHEIILTSHNAITGVSNYLIQKVTLTYDDGQQDLSGIIDNATSNTTDIINNNNANATETQNAITGVGANIINELANRCNNIANMGNFGVSVLCNDSGNLCNNGGSISSLSSNGNLTFNGTTWSGVIYNSYIPVENIDLYLLFKSNVRNYIKVSGYDENYNYTSQRTFSVYATDDNVVPLCSSTNVSVCNSLITKYVKFSIENQSDNSSFTITDLRINTNRGPFCVFGSTISKLDELGGLLGGIGDNINDKLGDQNDLQQQQNDYLMDDTDPSVPTSDIEDTLDLVEINNPLGYLLTLPLTLISKINQSLTATCSDFELGHFGFSGSGWNTDLKFPCLNPQQQLGSSLWTTIDIIVAVGLLALTVYKIYQAVSNILTLGGEDEVSGSFVYWTPMEFLAIICGGTSVGVFQRRSKQ